MQNFQRRALAALPRMAAGLLMLFSLAAAGQHNPQRPVRIVVGTTAGSGIDIGARILGAKMRDALGQPVVIELRPGGDGIIAARLAAAATPDGHTLLAASNGHMAINPVVHVKLAYDPLVDFEPVSMLSRNPSVLVVNDALPVKSMRDLVAHARSRPAQMRYGASSSNYMFAMELLKKLTGIEAQHIPYNGNAQVGIALLAGDVHMALVSVPSLVGVIQSGKLRALAVAGLAREPILAGVPTLTEAGVEGFDLDVWVGVFAPAKTPADIIARLNTVIQRSLQAADVQGQFAAAGAAAAASTPWSLRDTILRDQKIYRELAAALPPGPR